MPKLGSYATTPRNRFDLRVQEARAALLSADCAGARYAADAAAGIASTSAQRATIQRLNKAMRRCPTGLGRGRGARKRRR